MLNTERSYITEAEVFSLPVTNPSFNMFFEMSQSQPLQTDICLMSILCKRATSSKGHANTQWAVIGGFWSVCLARFV